MKKKKLLVIGSLVLLAAVFCIICKPIFYRFYPFDRIKGTVSLNVDGEKIVLTQDDIVLYDKKYDKYEDGSAKDISDGRVKIYMDGTGYGGHCFQIDTDKLEEPIKVCCYQHNWWNVMDFDIDISVNGGYLSCSGKYSFIVDNGSKHYDEIGDPPSTAPTKKERYISFGI